ncbi:MAG: GFA family protein [Rhodocyclaceae bacterium]
MSRMELQGRCLCGAVTLSVVAKGEKIGACHCSMCRKWSGGPMLAVECEDDVSIEGGEHLTVYASSDWAERGFCGTCGTHLFYRLRDGTHYAVPVGLLEDSPAWSFDSQIFIDEKPAYYSFANPTRNLTGAEVFALYAPPGGQDQG